MPVATKPCQPLPGFEGIFVSDEGSVWSNRSGRLRKLKTHQRRDGNHYVIVILRKERGSKSKPRNCYVHRLVLETFVGPCPEGMQCRHLDGNPANNLLSNICWGTPGENAADKERHGTKVRGSKHGAAKLTENVVAEIRALRSQGIRLKALASRFGVSEGAINSVIRGKHWKHTYQNTFTPVGFAGEANGRAKLSAAQVAEILRLQGTMPQTHLAAKFRVSPSTVRAIITGRNWRKANGRNVAI